ncbi:hypothetical protein KFK09_014858 [Dendrobium nobile]|uniref:Uncharacterized protein n=1 Tax=Dendrobium nobile TaxID=94219 RepID=A0A8T3B491_DENNO|nr:hypothetical protein KFK09_014858 [Dendrobium nobile]
MANPDSSSSTAPPPAAADVASPVSSLTSTMAEFTIPASLKFLVCRLRITLSRALYELLNFLSAWRLYTLFCAVKR